MKNFNTSVQRQELDAQLYDERHKFKCAELLQSGLIPVGSISGKAVSFLELEGIFRAANDAAALNLNNLTQLPGTFGESAPRPAAREPLQTGKAKERRPASTDKSEKATPITTIDAESKEILRYISEDFVLLTAGSRSMAYHIESGDQIGKEGFIQYCAKHYGEVLFVDSAGNQVDRASSGQIWWAWNDPSRRVVKSIVMEPTSKPEHEGDPTAYNRWYTLKKTMAEPNYAATQEDIALLVDHLMFISDGDEVAVMYFLCWLAQLYQFPETKIPVAVLMYSRVGGVGKNLIQRLLTKVFGKPLVTGCTGKMLQSNFMDAIEHRRMVFINEVAKTEKADGYENLKSQISEESVSFEGKGRAAREIKNIAHYIITTNNLDALPLMQGDRRIAVLMCDSVPKSTTYYEKLVAWIDGPGAPALANVLRCWEFPESWNPYAPAPQTDAARIMQRESRGALHAIVEELIEGHRAPFDRDLVTINAACLALETQYGKILQREISPVKLGRVLNDICGKPSQKDIRRPGQATERKVRYYVVRNGEKWEKSTPEQRGDHLEKGTPLFAVSTETQGSEVDSHES